VRVLDYYPKKDTIKFFYCQFRMTFVQLKRRVEFVNYKCLHLCQEADFLDYHINVKLNIIMNHPILIVEDEKKIADTLCYALSYAGMNAQWVSSGAYEKAAL
jgi:hypothetical protein